MPLFDIDKDDYKLLGKSNERVVAVGYGTWGVGGSFSADYSRDDHWIKIIRHAVKIGLNLIDTAEMYGAGHAEELVGEAIKIFPREEVFVVSKVWSTNLHYDDLLKSARKSLKRLGLSYIDLYLIHWPNPSIPLSESMKAMEKLVEDGLVRYIGVSNFNVREMEEARSYLSKVDIVVNQVKYSLRDRAVEREILPYCIREGITLMAYTPLEKGSLARNPKLREVGSKYGKSAAQVALNWLISRPRVITIPKAGSFEHLEENRGAMGWRLSPSDIEKLEKIF
ncbi:MAG: aldo/keto reductase [Candidatus Njordarchaeia archaeon]